MIRSVGMCSVAPARLAKGARTRAQLVYASEQLLLDEGYASVTSRRVGNADGVAPKL